MRKNIFAFAVTALALWWGFGAVVTSMKYTDPKSEKAKRCLNSAFAARGMRVVPDQIVELAEEMMCRWDEKYWDIVAANMVKIAMGELTPEQSQQMLHTIVAATEKEV